MVGLSITIKENDTITLTEAYAAIDTIAARYELVKKGQGLFESLDTPNDLAQCGLTMSVLEKKPWFLPNLAAMTLTVDGEDEDAGAYYLEKHGLLP